MALMRKLLEIQCEVDVFLKTMQVGEGRQAYKAVDSEQVLDTIRPLMNEKGLLLFPEVRMARVIVGATSSGTARYLTELDMTMTWHEVETGEERSFGWYAQGVDLAGEKGVGKAQTYGEKYFLLKFFHIPTKKDDPDSSGRTESGELRQKGTQAAKETADYQRASIAQMFDELCGGDPAKIKSSYIAYTQNPKRGYGGTDNLDKASNALLAVIYGQVKGKYKELTGKDFIFEAQDEAVNEEDDY